MPESRSSQGLSYVSGIQICSLVDAKRIILDE